MYINPWIPLNNPWIQSVFSTKSNECHAKSHESHVWFCCRLFGYEGLLMDLDLDLTFWGVVFIRPMSSITGNFNFKIYIEPTSKSQRVASPWCTSWAEPGPWGDVSPCAAGRTSTYTPLRMSLVPRRPVICLRKKQPGAKIGPAHTHTIHHESDLLQLYEGSLSLCIDHHWPSPNGYPY